MSEKAKKLLELQKKVEACKSCKLAGTRSRVVFGEGNPEAELLFIGEGPGKQEDLSGRPFVGRAGELLTRLIEKGMRVPRSSVFIANIVKCRPTVDLKLQKDRAPDKEETQACSPFLLQQIDIIQPKVIVTLGNPSTQFLLQTTEGITKLRGKWKEFKGIPVLPTYHPSFVLRNGGEDSQVKKDIWSDFQLIMKQLGWPIRTTINWKD
ncbi:MAG: uracil-DNA glycosylase [Leptospiraceae bacterium]|nr:uracil-DNA glycosylase [Leptospiraceae bacterium]MCP5498877.1 uracil-DNA glycosylase [Leptospiraceae bacterium]